MKILETIFVALLFLTLSSTQDDDGTEHSTIEATESTQSYDESTGVTGTLSIELNIMTDSELSTQSGTSLGEIATTATIFSGEVATTATSNSGELATTATTDSGEVETTATSNSGEVPTTATSNSGELATTATTDLGEVATTATSNSGELATTAATDSGEVATAATSNSGEVATTATSNSGELATRATTDSDEVATTATSNSGELATTATTDSGELPTTTTNDSGEVTRTATSNSGEVATTATSNSGELATTATTDSGEVATTATSNSGELATTATIDSGELPTTATNDSGEVAKTITNDSGELATATIDSGEVATTATNDSGELPTTATIDSGELTTATIDSGELATAATINLVRLPPSITKGPPRNRTYQSGDNVTLECKGKGVPDVTYVWKKNGNKLSETLQNIQRGADGTITILSATSMDEGFYQCFARNQYGTALSNTTHLQWAFIGSTTTNTTDVHNKTVEGGRPFRIKCDPPRSFPKATFTWEIANDIADEQPIPFQLSKRIQITENGDLYFASALPEDEGRLYRCTTHNDYLNITKGGSFTQLTLDPRPPSEMRRRRDLGFSPGTQTVAVIGRSATLRCFFFWTWWSNISWSGPGHTLPAGRYTLNNFNTSLTIHNVAASDEGEYICAADGTRFPPRMRVEAVPVFPTVNDAPYNVNLTEGESFTFRCNATAKPEAKIVWLQDGKELDPNNLPRRFMFSNDRKSLTIRDICRDCVDRESKTDLMVIQCNASNVHGYAFAQGYLNVLGKTIVTVNGERHENKRRIAMESSKSIQISLACRAISDPSTPLSVRWYKMENDEEQPVNEDLFIVSMNMKDLSLTLHGNPKAKRKWTTYQGEYRCFGDSGFSNDTAIYEIILTETYCDNKFDKEHSILWYRTLVGKEIYRPCPGKTTGFCSRECLPNGIWSETKYNGCFDNEFTELLKMVKDLNAPAEKNQTAVAQKTSQLLALTNKSEGLTSGNLNASVMMINQLAVLKSGSTDSPNEKEIKSFVQATSNVLQSNNSKSWKELEAVNKTFATSILSSVEVYGRSLSMLNVSLSKCNKKEEDNLVFEAWSLEKSKRSLQLEFPNCSGWDENKISISMETLNSSISSERFHQPTRVWATYYPTIHNFLPGNKDLGSISSKVLSLSIDGLDANEKLTRPVLITLRHNQEESMNIRRTCAFWNVKRNDWDSTGCFVMSTTLNYTICSCDHLTNFAILMSISDASMTTHASDYKALSIISIIGCSISVAALILTIIVYALTWKQSKSAQATVLLNLCVALIIAYFVFIAGANKVESKHGCTAVAVLLHYFFLAAFFIMLAEGVELLLYIIFVFHVRTTIETVMLITSAWVLPLIIVSVSLGFTERKGYGNYDSDGNGQACWLSTENGLIWAFVGPVLFIITVNIIILAIVLSWMSKRKSFLANNEKKRSEIRATLWNMAVTCPVLGLGWLFGIFFLMSDHVFFQYLFVIANSLQGLLIFIFHALFHNKTAKEKISYVCSNYICGWRKTVSDDSNKRSSTQEPPKKTEKPGFVPIEVHDNKGMEKGDILLGTGTLTTSIGDSSTLESTQM